MVLQKYKVSNMRSKKNSNEESEPGRTSIEIYSLKDLAQPANKESGFPLAVIASYHIITDQGYAGKDDADYELKFIIQD